MKNDREKPDQPEGEGHLLRNIWNTVILVAVLAAAWFALEWLFGNK